eukprot:CAMPEP_0197680618 /NCGR_PEP_ID=MMETSP1338-20131121/93616_1 /TAXON_ID=43686 ORGANISM="Pelagodinium beii, Strain RCC1491" /NCGR_SAMPLE_ID=MMETSP1338 /ASSEMBLY_ACC=CAM_ASM_000754 /LENGTH=871 /DNA_ID=CAMNT_0043261831 /DNA_START=293 /DNA_END=2908 /DNA_ORIENTATION=-
MPLNAGISLQQTDLHEKLLGIIEKQQIEFEDLLHQNLTARSYQLVMNGIQALVEQALVDPIEVAVDSMVGVMKAQQQFDASWTGKTLLERKLLAANAHQLLLSSRQSTGVKLQFSGLGKDAVVYPHVSTLRVGFSSGEYVVTQIVDDNTSSPFVRYLNSEGTENMTLEVADFVTGEVKHEAQRYPIDPVPGWFCFQSQARLAAEIQETRNSWTSLHQVHGSTMLAVSRAAPVAHCGNYSCFDGVISADISVQYVSSIVTQALKALQEMFRLTEPDQIQKSSIFLVSQKSENREPGLLMGASDLESSTLPGLTQAYDVPGNNMEMVKAVSWALAEKHDGRWDHPNLVDGSLFHFRLSAAAAQNYLSCNARRASLDKDSDCIVAGTQSLQLDNDTSWLIIVAMPVHLISKDVVELAEEIQGTTDAFKVDASHKMLLQWSVAIGAIGLIAVCASLMAFSLGMFVSRPLQELGNLKELMSKLEDLELGVENEALQHLREGKRSRIREVCNLQNAFCGMMNGIESFGRFVPKRVVRDIVKKKDGTSGLMHAARRRVTIMFSDVANFTTLAESMQEADLLLLLTRYLSVMTSIVETYQGEVAEILGDGLLIFWNTPGPVDDHADQACLAALAMQAAIPLLNQQLAEYGLPTLEIRVGIHTGMVLSGLIGSSQRLKFGCMGDPVNLASRMEGLCKFFGVGILCSAATVEALSDEGRFIFRRMGCVQVKGKTEPTMVHELMDSSYESYAVHTCASQSSGEEMVHMFSHAAVSAACAQVASQLLASGADETVCPEVARAETGGSRTCISRVSTCRAKEDYETALEAYEEDRLADAKSLLQQSLEQRPDDRASQSLMRLVEQASAMGTASPARRIMKPDEK